MPRFNNYGVCNECELRKNFLICSDCCICVCFDCLNKYNHDKCIKCEQTATCNINKICYDCNINHYNMITEYVAVGDCDASYDDFDIIVNLFGEYNGCDINQITLVMDRDKKIYNVGLIDRPEYREIALSLLKVLIPELVLEKNKRILFHCYAGISRSATFAIAYLMKNNNLSFYNAFALVKLHRSIIHPNSGFIEILNNFS